MRDVIDDDERHKRALTPPMKIGQLISILRGTTRGRSALHVYAQISNSSYVHKVKRENRGRGINEAVRLLFCAIELNCYRIKKLKDIDLTVGKPPRYNDY